MCIASLYKDVAIDRYFPGEIDEVRIWNTDRTSAEIRANMHHELQGNEANLVAYYKLDTGTGTTADDSSNGGYNGTLTNGPAWQTSGAMSVPGNALDFDGTNNEYVDCGNVGTGVKTVEFWVKPTSNTDHFLDLDNGTHYVQAVAGTVTADNFASPTVYVCPTFHYATGHHGNWAFLNKLIENRIEHDITSKYIFSLIMYLERP